MVTLARWCGCLITASVLWACGDSGQQSSSSCSPPTGCNLKQAAEVAGIRVGVAAAPGDDERTQLIVREFNALSPEGELTWSMVHPGPDEWDLDPADRVLGFAASNSMFTTVSHFVWDQAVAISTTPAWVKAICDPAELRRVMHDHLKRLEERYGSRIGRWIVVNEPFWYFGDTLYPNHFYLVLGPDYIAEAFRIAAEAAPSSERILNEILTEYQPAKADALVRLATDLVSRGVPIDGVGLQGHLFFGDPDFELIEDTMRRIGALGLKVAITELDAPVLAFQPDRLEVQAVRMSRMVGACLAIPACDSVTFWGLEDSMSWLNWFLWPGLDPLLFDDSLQPKPAYLAVRDRLAAGR